MSGMELPDPTWFDQTARENFERHLLPLADQPLHCLQLGAFAGDATMWMLAHLPQSVLTDVDTWGGSDGLYGEWDLEEVLALYLRRTKGLTQVITYQMPASHYLRNSQSLAASFDFIYIDADHHAEAVLADAVNAWPLLKIGGLMAFDDYIWEAPSGDELDSPHPAVDAFCSIYGRHLEMVEDNQQKWVRKA